MSLTGFFLGGIIVMDYYERGNTTRLRRFPLTLQARNDRKNHVS